MNKHTPIAFGLGSLISERRRSLPVIFGLALAVALYVAVSIISTGYTSLVALPFSQLNTDLIVQRTIKGQQNGQTTEIRLPFSNQPVSKAEIKAIKTLPEVTGISESLILWHKTGRQSTTIAGIDPETNQGPARVMQWLKKGRSLKHPGEIVVESHFARFHKIKIGDLVPLGQDSFKVVGIARIKKGASIAAASYYILINDARKISRTTDSNMLFIKLKKGVETRDIQEKIQTMLPGAIASTTDNIGSMMKGFARISNLVSRLLDWATLTFAAILSYWLVSGSLGERRTRFGLLKTIGWQQKDLLTAIITETLCTGLIGAVAGIALGFVIGQMAGLTEISINLPWNLAMTSPGHGSATGQTISLPVILQTSTSLLALLAATLSAAIAGLMNCQRLARIRPSQILKQL